MTLFQGNPVMFSRALDLLYPSGDVQSEISGASMTGDTEEGVGAREEKWKTRFILAGIGLAGLGLILGHYAIPAVHSFWRGITEHLGTALIISCVIGVTIDEWMKKKIARNVFNAALGYMLPDEFKREINRIAGFKFLATHHSMRVLLEPIDGTECVRATIEVERTIQNISSEVLEQWNMSHIDEWGFVVERSRIEKCEIEGPDGRVYEGMPVEALSSRIRMQTQKITVRPKQSVKLRSKLVEIRRNNDHVMVAFTTPIRNPTITINAPDTLECRPSFGSIDPFESAHFEKRFTLNGTYFPGIHMSVRWHPKAQVSL